ncbi:MAG: ubiquinol-cytochrome c reductase iron-sulfur subunit [Saccharospirillaceae bacterium]|nr:ubiquinol-cytochrome c reductase iron-sulfur subunit [Pseudomonadales bacterium]NRB81147.1 ubiquinol-cytochrome c reductase iron-sulfur subunit [Saccharospirillaceae bacterium]
MNQDDSNLGRRRFLLVSMAGIGGVGMVGAAVPFVAAWNPSERAKALGGPTSIDIGKLEVGRLVVDAWRGSPVYVVKRSPEMIAALSEEAVKKLLKDPELKDTAQQPDFANNDYRSLNPELLVLVGVCTHLGCAPKLRAEPEADMYGYGGFYCPCHGSKFDLAGRVYKSSPAGKNLLVPPYVVEGSKLIIGVEA